MTANEAIKKIRVMLGMETEAEVKSVELAEVALVDGTIVKVEGDLAEGKALFVVSEEGDIPAPEGIHETADGMLISVNADGVITSVVEKVEETEASVEKEEMSDEASNFSDEMIGAIAELIKPLNDKISAIEGKFSSLNKDFDAFRNEPAGEKVSNNYFSSEKTNTKDARLEMLASLRKNKK